MEHAQNGSKISDIEDYCKSLPIDYKWRDLTMPTSQQEILRPILYEMLEMLEKGISKLQVFRDLQRKHHMSIKPRHFTQVYLAEQELGLM